jgi:hypothetical protein
MSQILREVDIDTSACESRLTLYVKMLTPFSSAALNIYIYEKQLFRLESVRVGKRVLPQVAFFSSLAIGEDVCDIDSMYPILLHRRLYCHGFVLSFRMLSTSASHPFIQCRSHRCHSRSGDGRRYRWWRVVDVDDKHWTICTYAKHTALGAGFNTIAFSILKVL